MIPDAMLTRLNQLEKEFLNSSEESGSEEELEGLTENDHNEDDTDEDAEEESEDDDTQSKSSKNSKERESSILTRATSSITNFFSLR